MRLCSVHGLATLMSAGALSAPLSAQQGRLVPFDIRADWLGVSHSSPWGTLPAANPLGPLDDCTVVASHTDANFGGGQFVMQLGFGEGESLGASYTVSANQFPIKIDLAEVIFASIASQTTTTEWTVRFYDGTPATGIMVASFSSDNVLLPHIQLPPGSPTNPQGVNLQFSIDPADPEQVIIENLTGTNTFSVEWRVDKHNNQTQNPCVIAPPPSSNAFPVTDASGLLSPSGNWLFGLNCGPLGCPPNGGWSTFGALNILCKPSGDWVTRVTWSSINCAPGVGACCKVDGTCEVLTATACTGIGGTYQGDATNCGQANCPQPTGACCFGNGCLTLTQGDCTTAGGTYLGHGVACGASNTCPTGACCLPNGTCIDGVTISQCLAQSGLFQGAGTLCSGVSCPQPKGACCLSNGSCLSLTQGDCGVIPGSSWAGAGTTCIDSNSNGKADVCEACYADCDISGQLDFFDFLCFQNEFSAQTAYADCDQNLSHDFFDFLCFQNSFAAGCP